MLTGAGCAAGALAGCCCGPDLGVPEEPRDAEAEDVRERDEQPDEDRAARRHGDHDREQDDQQRGRRPAARRLAPQREVLVDRGAHGDEQEVAEAGPVQLPGAERAPDHAGRERAGSEHGRDGHAVEHAPRPRSHKARRVGRGRQQEPQVQEHPRDADRERDGQQAPRGVLVELLRQLLLPLRVAQEPLEAGLEVAVGLRLRIALDRRTRAKRDPERLWNLVQRDAGRAVAALVHHHVRARARGWARAA